MAWSCRFVSGFVSMKGKKSSWERNRSPLPCDETTSCQETSVILSLCFSPARTRSQLRRFPILHKIHLSLSLSVSLCLSLSLSLSLSPQCVYSVTIFTSWSYYHSGPVHTLPPYNCQYSLHSQNSWSNNTHTHTVYSTLTPIKHTPSTCQLMILFYYINTVQ